jgi:pyruvate carboxylase
VAGLGSGWLPAVRRILEDLASSDVASFELSHPDLRLRVRRRVGARASAAAAEPAEALPDGVPIAAPFTGMFYRAASAGADPYVREGDWLATGTTIGLIETMKVFNEVKTEQAGRIARFTVPNGQLVQAGDVLAVLVPEEGPGDEGRPPG